jgi:hypothetical protein
MDTKKIFGIRIEIIGYLIAALFVFGGSAGILRK